MSDYLIPRCGDERGDPEFVMDWYESGGVEITVNGASPEALRSAIRYLEAMLDQSL